MATGVTRLKINSICAGTSNCTVVGIIVAKQSPRTIRFKKDNKEKSVFSFTIRDSPEDLINVNVWGSIEYTQRLYDNYKIGHVVDLINSNVKFKPDIEEKFMPKSSSSFLLTLNENSSQMTFHDVCDSTNYKCLLRVPTSPPNTYIKIEDIYSSGKEMCGKSCNLLVAVRCVMPMKLITTKNGKKTFLREIIVMDKTHPTLIVRIWDKELMEKSNQWTPKETILEFSNLYLEWNIFEKKMTAVISNKTIITEDPNTNEATDLKNYSNTYVHSGLSNKLHINIPKLSTITNIMTCKRVLINSNESEQTFTAVIYAIVSKFNIDGLYPLIFTKCNQCGMKLENTHLMCFNELCPTYRKMENGLDELESILNIRLSLTDCTGTLDNCVLHHQTATKILNEIKNFQTMSLNQKTELKWKYLFTNCTIKIVLTKASTGKKLTVVIVDIENTGPICQYTSISKKTLKDIDKGKKFSINQYRHLEYRNEMKGYLTASYYTDNLQSMSNNIFNKNTKNLYEEILNLPTLNRASSDYNINGS